jgi:hypothetical protein
MTTQYVTVHLGGSRTYTYVNDEPDDIVLGDVVEVTTPAGATIKGDVVGFSEQPAFNCKPCHKA